jgi:hypothetical protein
MFIEQLFIDHRTLLVVTGLSVQVSGRDPLVLCE